MESLREQVFSRAELRSVYVILGDGSPASNRTQSVVKCIDVNLVYIQGESVEIVFKRTERVSHINHFALISFLLSLFDTSQNLLCNQAL